jgi:hypothetical protein
MILNHVLLILLIVACLSPTSNIILPDAFAQGPEHRPFHGTQTVAGYHVELTVEPMPIEPDALTKFGTVFSEAATGEHASVVPHSFVLLKDGKIIFRESTENAHYMHEFRFAEEHKGALTVLIENINNSGENAEFSLTVVPEFPVSTVIAMAAAIMTFLIVLRGISAKRMKT